MTTTGHRTGTARRLGAAPDPVALDPAQRLGVDELRGLQVDRLRVTLRDVFAHVPDYRRASVGRLRRLVDQRERG